MPRYYFDTKNGGMAMPDRVGLVVDDLGEMRRRAFEALRGLAGDELRDGEDARAVTVRVRDETGRLVLHASMTVVIDELA